MIYENILFDLDGTLTDSGLGIMKGVQYALNFFGIHITDLDELRKFVGPPLYKGYMDFYGFSLEKAKEITEKQREYYSKIGIFENEVYEEIPQLLEELKANGKNLIIATSKPIIYTEILLDHFDLRKFFTVVCGSDLDGTHSKKSEVISLALEKSNISASDLSKTVMVGDREYDILGARENNLKSIGVLYGYGSLTELESAGADFIAENIEELKALLLSKS